MKIKRTSRFSKKPVVIGLIIGIVCLFGYGVYASMTQSWPFTPAQTSESTGSSNTPQTDTDNSTTDQDGDVPVSSDDTPSPKTPVANEPDADSPSSQGTLSVSITSVNQEGDVLKIRSQIKTVTNEGTCTLALEKGDATVTRTSGIQALPSTSACKGFSISLNDLSKGVWRIKVSVTSDQKTGSATQQYEVQ